MKIELTKRAKKQLHMLPRTVATRIVKKLHWYALQDDPLSFAKHLTNPKEGEYRFRIGNYRVIVDVKHNTVHVLIVLDIRKRDHVYD